MDAVLDIFVPTTAAMAWSLTCAARAALVLAGSWVGASLLRGSSPAARHRVWALGVAGALLVPLISWSLPAGVLPFALPMPELDAPPPEVDLSAGPYVLLSAAEYTPEPTWPLWLALGWASGALAVALRFLRGHLAAWRLVGAAEPLSSDAARVALADGAASIGIPAPALLRSRSIGSPMTIGALRPRILLPAEADAWTGERLRAVLVHELGHVSRRDALVQVGAQLACALYWWNPLVWLAARRLREEREHACDDLVLSAGTQPSSYAADLLAVARRISADAPAHAGAVCAVGPSWTEARLRRILDPVAPRRAPSSAFTLGVTVATMVLTMAASASAESMPRSERERIDRVVIDGIGDVNACFPTDAPDQMKMHWSVDDQGRTVEACITSEIREDQAVRDCVNKHVNEGDFRGIAGQTVEYSFPIPGC